jgi:DNA-binding beta-propeller fold protein YncE
MGILRGQARATTLAALPLLVGLTLLLPAGASAVDGSGDTIYWGNEGANTIRFGSLDGTGTAATLVTQPTGSGPCGVAIDPAAGKLYWGNFDSREVRRANLDGTGTPSTLFTDSGRVCGVAIDPVAGKIYWANFDSNSIQVASLDGSGSPSTLYVEPGGSHPSGVAIDPAAGKIYWTNQDSDEVRVGELDGSGASTLFGPADAGDNPIGVAVDPAAGKIYWTALRSNEVKTGNLDGSGATTLFGGETGGPGGVALDPAAGKIYWATFSLGSMRFGNLNGSGSAGTLFPLESTPLFPALLRAPVGVQVPAVSGGSSFGVPLSCSTGSWAPNLLGAFLYRAPRTFSYQWQLDGSDISGATASTYTFTLPGDYTCRVTASNHAGSASQTSAPFTVTLLSVQKFYDANTNGQRDASESGIAGWRVRVGGTTYVTPASLKVAPGVHTVSELDPRETNWKHTNAASVQATASAGDETTVAFGNVCVGAGGAMGTGFWGNKNGAKLFGADDLALMVGLNLRNADGSNFDPATYSAFSAWIGKASGGQNMAYGLSGQLAALALDVHNGKVNGSSLIHAPGSTSANAAGFATVNTVLAEANAELGLHGLTGSGSPFRAYQSALSGILANANGNKTFAQASPCAFSFR